MGSPFSGVVQYEIDQKLFHSVPTGVGECLSAVGGSECTKAAIVLRPPDRPSMMLRSRNIHLRLAVIAELTAPPTYQTKLDAPLSGQRHTVRFLISG